MDPSIAKPSCIKPRLIIHGGAGNVNRENVTKEAYEVYRSVMLEILHEANAMLTVPNASAVDVATFAVQQLELNPMFNAGKGAVYTTAGTHELEASIMVSNGYRKRGVGVMNVKRTKSPITLAKAMLINGEAPNGGGAQGHSQLQGDICDSLAEAWGLEMVPPSYFWSRRRWDEHRRGLGLSHTDEEYEKAKANADGAGADSTAFDGPMAVKLTNDPSWNGKEYLPQGTVGAVAMDASGTLCVCTSTGGITNKLPGRIGDTPTLGAGFWAEEWRCRESMTPTPQLPAVAEITGFLRHCMPALFDWPAGSSNGHIMEELTAQRARRAVAMSGTGNGDSFLRVNAVRTAAAIARFSGPHLSLEQAVTKVAGPNGALQQSAGDRWQKTGEGEGGIIGIELVDGKGKCVADFNCGGMFRAWVDDHDKERFLAFRGEY